MLIPIAGVVLAVSLSILVPVFRAEPAEAAAATAPEPTVERVTVAVHTIPEGARVLRDGEELGVTPCDLELEAGAEVQLRVEREGFLPRDHAITPEAGMEPVEIGLEAVPFVLRLRGVPEGAEVEVDGTLRADPSEITLGAVDAPVRVEVRARGFRPFNAELRPDDFTLDGERRSSALDVTLARRAGSPRASAPAVEGLPTNPF